ncbi:MAG: peroxiredoxin [Actinobacteria bacterium]|nr:peroxiredoxin [Actinomycetota bacterium]
MVEEGSAAPDFELESDTGDKISLSDFRGRPVVLYFYPRSDTPGCTTQASGIRDSYREFEQRGAVVLGVSSDTVRAQARFKAKYGLPFTLLADTERKAGEAYGVTREGKTSLARATFIIDSEGSVCKVMPKANPTTHTDEVLAALG